MITGLSIGSLIQYTIHQLVCAPVPLNIGFGVYIAHRFHAHLESYPSLRHIFITSESNILLDKSIPASLFSYKATSQISLSAPAYISYNAFCGQASKIYHSLLRLFMIFCPNFYPSINYTIDLKTAFYSTSL